MINNDKNLWKKIGFLSHGMKDNQKTYWKDELLLLLDESSSVTSKYREVITKTEDSVLFCLNQDCNNVVDFAEALFWSDLSLENSEDDVKYIIDYNKGLVLCIYGVYDDLANSLLDMIKNYGGFMPVDYLSKDKSMEIINNLTW